MAEGETLTAKLSLGARACSMRARRDVTCEPSGASKKSTRATSAWRRRSLSSSSCRLARCRAFDRVVTCRSSSAARASISAYSCERALRNSSTNCASLIPSQRSTCMTSASPFASWTSWASHWNASTHSSRAGRTWIPPAGEMAPNRRNRRHTATRALDAALDGNEYENTTQLIGHLPLNPKCNIYFRKSQQKLRTYQGARRRALGGEGREVRQDWGDRSARRAEGCWARERPRQPVAAGVAWWETT